MSQGGALMSVPVTTGANFSAGSPHVMFEVRLLPLIVRNRWLATPDGERFLFLQPEGSNRSLPMTVVINWAEALPER